MWGEVGQAKVYLALGPTDLRRSINGLSLLVTEVLESDPFSESRYIFCTRRRDKSTKSSPIAAPSASPVIAPSRPICRGRK